MSKEYWVNVVDRSEHLHWYYSEHISSYWLKAPWALAKYRLHIKMKDEPGLSRRYPLKMINGMVTLNELPKYKELEDLRPINYRLRDTHWMD